MRAKKNIAIALYSIVAIFIIIFVNKNIRANELDRVIVNVFPESEIHQNQIKLKDIAEIEAFDLDLLRALSDLNIAQAPRIGYKLKLSGNRINALLKKAYPNKKFDLFIPKKAIVTRSSFVLPKKKLAKLIEKKIANKLENYDNYEIEYRSSMNDIILPSGKLDINIAESNSSNKIGGNMTWKVDLMLNDKKHKSIYVRVYVKVKDEVAVVASSLKKGSRITQADIEKRLVDITNKPLHFQQSAQDFIGKNAAQNLKAGTIITQKDVSLPLAVKKGQRVVVSLQSSAIELTMLATSTENGKIGDVILVKNADSNKMIEAKIISNDRVKVLL